jgi:uncharacterized protein (TIGR03790 family)
MQRRSSLCAASLAALVLLPPAPSAGGGAERAVLVVDPASPESLYVANVYLARRDVPRGNAIYLPAAAASWTAFVAENQRAFEGALDHQRLRDRADFVIVPPGGPFYLGAAGYVGDACAPVNRFAIASAFTLDQVSALIQGGVAHSSKNHFAQAGWDARWFDAQVPWFHGEPSAGGHRYRIGAMLGYTGANGNTLQEVLDLVERSAAADATQPGGTFYYVQTTDFARSGPRHFTYPEAVQQMAAIGGVGAHIFDVLPVGHHDCLGVMTGWASPDVDGASYTLLPGAFGDHLTSYAGAFDIASQTKMSEWIEKGASGTSGAVEEPCNYSGKFPHARIHVLYRQGMALGEAWLASMEFLPFQNLLYGDPLTAPWAQPPSVDVPGLPSGAVSGSVALAPVASATAAGASIAELELLIDGSTVASVAGGGGFLLDTTALADGPHEVRVLAYDDTPVRNAGRFVGALDVSNAGRAVGGVPSGTAGDLATAFDVAVTATGGTLAEVRLMQGARVVAAGGPGTTALRVYGQNVGAGPVRLFLEADFAGGGRARSAPLDLDVSYAGTGSALPVAHSYSRTVAVDTPALIELPASYPDDPGLAVATILQPPGQAAILANHGGPWLAIAPLPGAVGLDTLTFEVATPGGTSAPATILLEYVPKAAFAEPDFFRLDAVDPPALPALVPGTAKTVDLHGGGFGPATVVEVDGVALGGLLQPYAFESPTLISLDMPQVGHLGTVTIGVTDGTLHDEISVPMLPTSAPTLQMAGGDPGAVVFQALGVDAILAGTPGASQVLVASIYPAPSVLPGVVALDLGAAFAFVPIVGTYAIDATQGWTKVHIPLSNIPPGTKIYAQAVELAPAFPFAVSNRQEFVVLF